MSVLISIISFVVALGLLVFVHEFGHFWVARRCGVRVVRFSIGFGKSLFSFKRKNDPTEYQVAAIPLGGYVKMLDERETEVLEHEKHLAFNYKPLWQKTLIVLAGPAFNFIFAIICFWSILLIGETGLKPVVGKISQTSIVADSGLEAGDEVLSINAKETPIWRIMLSRLVTSIIDDKSAQLDIVKSDGRQVSLTIIVPEDVQIEPSEIHEQLGIAPQAPFLAPVIAEVLPDEPADVAGLRSGDRIISVDNLVVEDWGQWVEITQKSALLPLKVEIDRAGQRMDLTVIPAESGSDERSIGRIGVTPQVDPSLFLPFQRLYQLDVIPAFFEAVHQTTSYSILTLKLIGRILLGEASLKNLSGPISIAQYAGQSASIGALSFVKFLAFVSLSLGVINLLPVPMLDGGHLLFYLIEAVKGSPVSEKNQEAFTRFGAMILFMLMMIVLFVDIERLAG